MLMIVDEEVVLLVVKVLLEVNVKFEVKVSWLVAERSRLRSQE